MKIISEIKFEAVRIHFLSDVFLAVPIVVAWFLYIEWKYLMNMLGAMTAMKDLGLLIIR